VESAGGWGRLWIERIDNPGTFLYSEEAPDENSARAAEGGVSKAKTALFAGGS
jgi:hypothetical protein